jgi:hypothetical protein
MRIEPSSADCGMEVGGNHLLSTNFKDCTLEINVVMPDLEEEEDKELLPISATAQANVRYRDWRARLRTSTVAFSSWKVKLRI